MRLRTPSEMAKKSKLSQEYFVEGAGVRAGGTVDGKVGDTSGAAVDGKIKVKNTAWAAQQRVGQHHLLELGAVL